MNLFMLSILAFSLHLIQGGIEEIPENIQFIIDTMKEKNPEEVDRLIKECKTNEELREKLLEMHEDYDFPEYFPLDLKMEEGKYDPNIIRLLKIVEQQNGWIMKVWDKNEELKDKVKELTEDVVRANFGILSYLARKEIDENVKADKSPYSYMDKKSGGLVLNKDWEFRILNAKNELTDNMVVFNFDNSKFANPNGNLVRKKSLAAIPKGSVKSRAEKFEKKVSPPAGIEINANDAGGGKSPRNSPRANMKPGAYHEVDVNGAPASPPNSPHKGQNPNPFGHAANHAVKIQPQYLAQPIGAY